MPIENDISWETKAEREARERLIQQRAEKQKLEEQTEVKKSESGLGRKIKSLLGRGQKSGK